MKGGELKMNTLQISNIIDTPDIQLPIIPTRDNIQKIKSKLVVDSTTKYGIGGAYTGKHKSGKYSFFYICSCHLLIVKLSHEAIIGIDNWKQIQQNVLDIVKEYFGIDKADIEVVREEKHKLGLEIRKPKIELNRTDYKIDSRYEGNEQQLIIQDIMRIAPATSRGYEQITYEYSDRTNVDYSNENSRGVSVTTYFKEFERLEAGDLEGAKKYKNIVRTEVKLHNRSSK